MTYKIDPSNYAFWKASDARPEPLSAETVEAFFRKVAAQGGPKTWRELHTPQCAAIKGLTEKDLRQCDCALAGMMVPG